LQIWETKEKDLVVPLEILMVQIEMAPVLEGTYQEGPATGEWTQLWLG
jgi:hypothetical protein